MTDFHLLRPEALLLLIPLIVLMFVKQRKKQLGGEWQKLIHPKLQPYVMQQPTAQGASSHWFVSTPLWTLGFIAVLALTGPTWQKQDSPVYNSRAGLVIALDLSLSMTAQDVTPSRLQRAKFKIIDVFEQTQVPAIALLAYAGDTHVATPLTRDTATIESLLPTLNPYMMPLHGSHLVRLAEQTAKLFNQGDSQPRQLLLITDGAEKQDIDAAAKILNDNGIELSILAVGTDQGAPLVKPDGSFFSDAQGNVIMPGLEMDNLQALQSATNGKLTRLTNDDSDLSYLLSGSATLDGFEQSEDSLAFDQWHDAGYWLVMLLIPLALFAFRRGVIAVVAISILPFTAEPAQAIEWRDWFRNGDQQGMNQFEENPKAAAELFNDPKWQASSEFKAGNYDSAAKTWANFEDSESQYNLGNALAKLNKLDDAIAAYDKVLEQQPDHEDAAFNKALLEQLKQQQEQQNQQGGDQNQDQQNSQNDGQQQNSENQSGQNSNQQNSNQQQGQSGEQDSEQQNQQQAQQSKDENSDGQSAEQDKLKEQEAQESSAQQNENAEGEDGQNAMVQSPAEQQAQAEKEQALQQWLQRIPDNPGGLLENKFRHQYSQRQYEDNNEDRKPW